MRRLCEAYRFFLNLMGQPLRLPRFNMMVVNFDKSRYFSVVFAQTLVTEIKDIFIEIAVNKISFIGGSPRIVCVAQHKHYPVSLGGFLKYRVADRLVLPERVHDKFVKARRFPVNNRVMG